MDNSQLSVATDPTVSARWVECLFVENGDKNACLHLAEKIVLSQATVSAVLILLSVSILICPLNHADY